MRTACIVIIALTLFSVTANAQQVTPSDAKRAERVAGLTDWVKRDGRNSFLAANGAQGFRLGYDNLPARRKVYKDDDRGIIYAVNLLQLNGREVHVLFNTTTDQSTLWRVGQSGAIDDVFVITTTTTFLSKDPHLTLLEETIAYLESEMRKARH